MTGQTYPSGAPLVAIVLTGSQGSRLQALSSATSRPNLPLSVRLLICDSVIANLHDSDVSRTLAATQSKPVDLHAPLRTTRQRHGADDGGAVRLPYDPDTTWRADGYVGTSDAAVRNRAPIDASELKTVIVVAKDHTRQKEVRRIRVTRHASGMRAPVTVTALPVGEAPVVGVIAIDGAGQIGSFPGQSRAALPIPGDPPCAILRPGFWVSNRAQPRARLPQAAPVRHDVGAWDSHRPTFPNMTVPALRHLSRTTRWPVRTDSTASDRGVGVADTAARAVPRAMPAGRVVMAGVEIGVGTRSKDEILAPRTSVPPGFAIGSDFLANGDCYLRTAGGTVLVTQDMIDLLHCDVLLAAHTDVAHMETPEDA